MHDKGNLRTGLVPVRVGVAEAVYTFMYGGGGQCLVYCLPCFRFVSVIEVSPR